MGVSCTDSGRFLLGGTGGLLGEVWCNDLERNTRGCSGD